MLMEFLVNQEVIAKAKTREECDRLLTELVDRCFEKTEVVVSNESYEELKSALRNLAAASNSKGTETNQPDIRPPSPDSFPPELLGRPLARSRLGVATIGDFLGIYFDTPPSRRPDIEKPEGVSAVLKALMRDLLLATEAEARGIHLTRRFRESLQLNRNVLTRFYFQDQLTDKAIARTKESNYEDRPRKWYQDQLSTRYTYTDSNGKKQTVPFDTERESIGNDFFEVLREEARADEVRVLRKGRKIWMDEARLDAMALSSRSSIDDDPASQTATAK